MRKIKAISEAACSRAFRWSGRPRGGHPVKDTDSAEPQEPWPRSGGVGGRRHRFPRDGQNGFHDSDVPRAATEVAAEMLADLCLRGVGEAIEEGLGRQDESGRAVATLQPA